MRTVTVFGNIFQCEMDCEFPSHQPMLHLTRRGHLESDIAKRFGGAVFHVFPE